MVEKACPIIGDPYLLAGADNLDIDNTADRIFALLIISKTGKILRSDEILHRVPHCLDIQLLRIMVAVAAREHIRLLPAVNIILIFFPFCALAGMKSVLYKFYFYNPDILRKVTVQRILQFLCIIEFGKFYARNLATGMHARVRPAGAIHMHAVSH